jgi:hypothetical protein
MNDVAHGTHAEGPVQISVGARRYAGHTLHDRRRCTRAYSWRRHFFDRQGRVAATRIMLTSNRVPGRCTVEPPAETPCGPLCVAAVGPPVGPRSGTVAECPGARHEAGIRHLTACSRAASAASSAEPWCTGPWPGSNTSASTFSTRDTYASLSTHMFEQRSRRLDTHDIQPISFTRLHRTGREPHIPLRPQHHVSWGRHPGTTVGFRHRKRRTSPDTCLVGAPPDRESRARRDRAPPPRSGRHPTGAEEAVFLRAR